MAEMRELRYLEMGIHWSELRLMSGMNQGAGLRRVFWGPGHSVPMFYVH